ncbi:hypothetical protein COU18_01590 [Candidatus Kaiserbacteria bacterium CG10_big_fil_rev_8_21_14_0_10_51_14]|uniref:Uncharacterized protein n=1 Tax=Candidatus Kaiserbacteria bacterium CG10_big_fil_rev_8_21_14_0_10_51_14 TaxID=1974610 RepID=A0A2H0UEH2_9BACT|nr:MAG: hypothetical protein COU18_01590 [Candidatus Kaiserbacteria bacterium CG10_big_fil_rev_8_21_14_0_10_51_14]
MERTHSSTRRLILIALGLAAVVAVLLFISSWGAQMRAGSISNFEECAAAGNPIMESYPEQCRTPDGRTFVRDISNDTSNGGDGIVFNGCAVAGCSGQLCVSADEAGDIVTTCEYRAEYACYKEAYCGPQADGTCGWSQTPELQRCLANPPTLDSSTGVVY